MRRHLYRGPIQPIRWAFCIYLYGDIENNGTLPAQLLHRYWKITDGEGGVREVHGDGVVGEQPTIVPGDEFTYTSGAILETAIGTHGRSLRNGCLRWRNFQSENPGIYAVKSRSAALMATYVVGDVQGCWERFSETALCPIFDPQNDHMVLPVT